MRLHLITLGLAVVSLGSEAAERPPSEDVCRRTLVTARDVAGTPVRGAAVRFLLPGAEGPKVGKECRTDPEGACAVVLRGGEATWVEVEKEGFVVSRRAGVEPGTPLAVVLDRPAVIQGKVVDQDGRPFGPLELLVVDVTILEDTGRVATIPPMIPVGEDGKFHVSSLPAGEYTLSPVAGDAASASMAEPVSAIRVASGRNVSGVVVRVVRNGSLAGRVVFPEGVPADVRVTPVPKGEPGGESPPFDKGYADARQRPCARDKDLECVFKLEGLQPGWYEVAVEAGGYGPFLAPLSENVLPGKTTKLPDLYAPSPVRLSGKVRDREKKHVAGALLAVYFPDIPLAVLDARSDEEGRFPPLLVSPGKYRLEISHPDFLTLEDRISVSGEFETHDLDLSLDAGNRLQGTYVSSSRQPKEGVDIAAEREGGGAFRQTRTDATGRFAFGGLPQGKYLVVALDGVDSAVRRVEVSDGSSPSIVIDSIKDRPQIPPPLPPEGAVP